MNIISRISPAIASQNRIIAQRTQSSPTFGHIYDYYDAEDIYEAREHGGVFREPGEDDISYERRAKRINDAFDKVQNQDRDNRSFWDKLLGS